MDNVFTLIVHGRHPLKCDDSMNFNMTSRFYAFLSHTVQKPVITKSPLHLSNHWLSDKISEGLGVQPQASQEKSSHPSEVSLLPHTATRTLQDSSKHSVKKGRSHMDYKDWTLWEHTGSSPMNWLIVQWEREPHQGRADVYSVPMSFFHLCSSSRAIPTAVRSTAMAVTQGTSAVSTQGCSS